MPSRRCGTKRCSAMAVNHRGVADFGAKLLALQEDMPNIMSDLVVGEARYAAGEAKKICKTDSPDIVNTGDYRRNWKHDTTAMRRGNSYSARCYNVLDYASHLEHGFRSHFVPGHWEGNVFVYSRDDPEGGMYVGPRNGYVRGHFTLKRAKKRTLDSQWPRLSRKWDAAVQRHIK